MSIGNTFKYNLEPGKTYVLFARHGQSEVNRNRCVGGSSERANLPLTEDGEKNGKLDAEKLGESLAPFKDQIKAVYTSSLIRAVQTTELARGKLGIAIKYKVDDALKEKFFGEALDGHPEAIYDQFSAKEKAETKEMNWKQKWSYKVVTDGESFEEVFARVEPFMFKVAKEHPGGLILAFGHKVSCIKVPAMGALEKAGIEVDYRDSDFNDPKPGATALYEVDAEKKAIRLVAIDGFSFNFLQKV